MRSQINITLGTAGHIDHGKTALIKCLTGCDTDRLKEEKERGMSIELGYAPCTLGELEVGIVDVPGHEHFIRTMVAGASGMDACMLVVAADDGPMPQTREHLDILTLLDVRHGVVVLTKIDRVSADELAAVREVLADFLKGTFLANAPVLPVSNVTGEGIAALYEALCAMLGHVRPRAVDGVFRMPVERAFSIKGHGTVIAGVPLAGTARSDDEIVLLTDGLTGRIKSIQVYGQASDAVLAGQCAAVNVRHWDHRVIERGKTVTVPGFFEPQHWCVARVRLLPQDRLFIKHGATVRFHSGTSDRLARAYVIRGDGLRGGDDVFVQFRFEEPLVAGPRDHFIIRGLTPPQTVGGGTILETLPARLNRNEPGIVERLERQLAAVGDDRSLVAFCAETNATPLIELAAVAHRAKVPIARTTAILEDLAAAGAMIRAAEGGYLHKETAESLGEQLLARVAEYHRASPESPGLALEELRATWEMSTGVLNAVVEYLRAGGRLRVEDQRLVLPDHQPTLQSADAESLQRLEGLLLLQLFSPPDPAEAAESLGMSEREVQRLFKMLLEQRRVIRIEREFIFHADALQRARELIINHIHEKGRLESVEFKYLLDTTRKYALPLLDYFDRTGLTRRCSDNTRLLRSTDIN